MVSLASHGGGLGKSGGVAAQLLQSELALSPFDVCLGLQEWVADLYELSVDGPWGYFRPFLESQGGGRPTWLSEAAATAVLLCGCTPS